MENITIEEMQNYLMNNTDHTVINEILATGMEWNKAIVLAYETVTK